GYDDGKMLAIARWSFRPCTAGTQLALDIQHQVTIWDVAIRREPNANRGGILQEHTHRMRGRCNFSDAIGRFHLQLEANPVQVGCVGVKRRQEYTASHMLR